MIVFAATYLYLAIPVLVAVFFLLQPRATQRRMALFAVALLPLAYVAAKLASLLFYDARPFVTGNFVPLIPHAADNGFPSDHTLLGAALSTLLVPFSKTVSSIAWILTIGVGVARVYAGIHHPIDIIGSIVIAATVGAIVYPLLPRSTTA